MDSSKIDRINALARKAKSPQGLTPEEVIERDTLRREYVDAVKGHLTAHLDNTHILHPDGTKRKLEKKQP